MSENTQTFTIPEKYAKLGVRRGFNPTHPEKLRMIIEGLSGTGKTTFLASTPDTVILDFDQAAENVYGAKAHIIPIRSWEEYQAVKQMVQSDAKTGTCPFTRVIFDTGDAFLDFMDIHIVHERKERAAGSPNAAIHGCSTIKEFGQSGAGYNILRAEMMKEIISFETAGLQWSAGIQLKRSEKTIGNVTTETITTWMYPTAFGLLAMRADLVGRVYTKQVPVDVHKTIKLPNGTERDTITGQKIVTKYFLDVMPEGEFTDQKRRLLGLNESIELPPVGGFDAFAEVYNRLIAALNKRTETENQ